MEKSGRTNNMAVNKSVKTRELLVLSAFGMFLLFLVYRVGIIQFIKGDEYRKMAYDIQTVRKKIVPKRGSLYDRNGGILAISASVDTVSVNPKALLKEMDYDQSRLQKIAVDLAEYIDMQVDDLMVILNKDSSFEFIKQKIDSEAGNRVKSYISNNKITNIYVDEDSKRFYPNGSLASHVLGFTGVDGQGLSGLELSLDATLKGSIGKNVNKTDLLGRQIDYVPEININAVDGYNVILTIDGTVQYLVEQALKQATVENKLKGGAAAVVMDPNTGEILAMASYPDFNPNQPDNKPEAVIDADWKGFQDVNDTQLLYQTVFRNKAIMDTYEPGSTFKSITAAAALEEGVVTPDTQVVDKPVTISGWVVDCWLRGGHGPEDFRSAVYNSCNPVFAKLGLSLGADKFYSYARMFGFMERTGIELFGEPSAQNYQNMWHKNPKEIDLAVASFGQRFQVSLLQMAAAYSAIANGGDLLRPTLVRHITDSNGNSIEKNEPKLVRRVLSEKTSAQLREILEGVVSKGTGKNAYVSGYRVAGKTGTSETLQTKSNGRYVISFAAIAPADKPRIVLIVILDHPQVDPKLISGGALAAPVAGKLSKEILDYLQVEPEITEVHP